MRAVFECKKCKFDGFAICEICGQSAGFEQKTTEAIFCKCGQGKITGLQCRCGNAIALNDLRLFSHFKNHWIHWTWISALGLFFVQCSNYQPRFRNDNAIGAIANQAEGETAGFAIMVLSIIGALLISWLPALITQKLSNVPAEGEPKTKGFSFNPNLGFAECMIALLIIVGIFLLLFALRKH